MPIVRTFAPFVAGVGSMHYRRFLAYNVFGAAVWVLLFMTAGVVFGQLPVVKDNLTLIALGIVAVSLLPVAGPLAAGAPYRHRLTGSHAAGDWRRL